jgi:hypothetical protein
VGGFGEAGALVRRCRGGRVVARSALYSFVERAGQQSHQQQAEGLNGADLRSTCIGGGVCAGAREGSSWMGWWHAGLFRGFGSARTAVIW